jgi:Fur family transcriptional regulator, ferric uptake regulator
VVDFVSGELPQKVDLRIVGMIWFMDEQTSENTPGSSRTGQIQESLEAFIRGLPRGTHLTAPEVLRQARLKGLKVSLSTVYRTLNNLSLLGQVKAFGSGEGRRYESSDSAPDHDHLICVKCGWTMEFEDKLIHGFGKTVAERKGYEYRHSRFDILGICRPCRLKVDDQKIDRTLAAVEKTLSVCLTATRQLDLARQQIRLRKFRKGREFLLPALPDLQEACRELQDCLDETAD